MKPTVNAALLALVAAFAAWEVIAGYWTTLDPPMMTLSEYVWAFEDRFGAVGQLIVGLLLALLFSHLVFRWPGGPPH